MIYKQMDTDWKGKCQNENRYRWTTARVLPLQMLISAIQLTRQLRHHTPSAPRRCVKICEVLCKSEEASRVGTALNLMSFDSSRKKRPDPLVDPFVVWGEQHVPKHSSDIWEQPGVLRPHPAIHVGLGYQCQPTARRPVCVGDKGDSCVIGTPWDPGPGPALLGLPHPWCSYMRAKILSLHPLPWRPFLAWVDSTSKKELNSLSSYEKKRNKARTPSPLLWSKPVSHLFPLHQHFPWLPLNRKVKSPEKIIYNPLLF